MNLLEQLLSSVKYGKTELTIELISGTPADIERITRAAVARGLHVAAGGRWVLIRDLRCGK